MKQLVTFIILAVLLLTACSNESKSNGEESTKSYTLDSGKKVDIPKNPKRIAVVANTYAGA